MLPTVTPTSSTGALRLPEAGLGEPPADLLRADRLPEPGRLLAAGVRRPSPRTPTSSSAPDVYTCKCFRRSSRICSVCPPHPGGSRRTSRSAIRLRRPRRKPCTRPCSSPSSAMPSSTDSTILANELAAQESTQTGGTLWAWKGLSRTTGVLLVHPLAAFELPDHRQWHARQGKPQVDAVPERPPHRVLRAAPDAGVAQWRPPGDWACTAYDPSTRTFAMTATSTAVGTPVAISRPTRWCPFRPPCTARGAVSGAARARRGRGPSLREPAGLRHHDDPPPPGTPAPLRHHRRPGICRAHRGVWRLKRSTPPAPISEPTARAMAESALTAEANSPNASIRSTAQPRARPRDHCPRAHGPQRLSAVGAPIPASPAAVVPADVPPTADSRDEPLARSALADLPAGRGASRWVCPSLRPHRWQTGMRPFVSGVWCWSSCAAMCKDSGEVMVLLSAVRIPLGHGAGDHALLCMSGRVRPTLRPRRFMTATG